MKSTIAICLMFLLVGCSKSETIPLGPLFCDIEEPRRFTQAEINWRAENAPWNLRRDFKTNAAWDEECAQ